jgi:Lon protease-like protein
LALPADEGGRVAELIPLFPLSHVLLPGMPLPLHIFEPRYRALLEDVSAGSESFGVVALRSGAEARNPHIHDADADVEPVGTLAEVLEVTPNDDGTSDLLAVGSRRFGIESLVHEGKPYLRAAVHFLDERDGELAAEDATRARELLEVYDDVLRRLAGRATGAELPDDPTMLSYHIAARLPLTPGDRQRLLVEATTAERLTHVAALLRRELALLQRTRSIAVSPTVLRLVTSGN